MKRSSLSRTCYAYRVKIPRQARLESAILLALRDEDAASVTGLADRLEASRASTSRAFAALARKGLVATDRRRRFLTDRGRQVADDLLQPSAVVQRAVEAEERQIRTLVERAQVKHFLGNTVMFDTLRALERKVASTDALAGPATAMRFAASAPVADLFASAALPELAAAKRFADLELDALKTSKLPHFAAALPDAAVRAAVVDIGKPIAHLPIPKDAFAGLLPSVSQEALKALTRGPGSVADRALGDFMAATHLAGRELAAAHAVTLGSAVAAAMDSIRLQIDVLGPALVARHEWVSALAESVSLGSAIFDDAAAIAAALPTTDVLSRRHARLSRAVEPLIVANRDNAAAELGWIVERSPMERAPLFLTPSVTTRSLSGVARLLVDGTERHGGSVPDPGDLFEILEARDMSSVSRDLRGARDAITRLPDGWPKTAAHLLREAMREVLLILAPDEEIANPDGVRITRRMRILHAASRGSETVSAVIDGAAKGWDDMVGYLSAEAHNENEPRLGRDGMIGGVVAVEGMIRMLLAAHDIGSYGPE
jgi:DNA-binding MarR family transcriptional regulator